MPPKKEDKKAAPADGGGADAALQLKQAEFVRQALESANIVLKGRVEELSHEGETLRKAREQLSKDAQAFVDYATAELRTKDQTIGSLRDELKLMEATKDAAFNDMQSKLQSALDSARASAAATEAELREKLRQSTSELEHVSQFLDLRADMESRLESLSHELEEEKRRGAEAVADMERRWLLDRSNTMKEQERVFAEMRRLARIEAQNAMTEEQHRLTVQNGQLSGEVSLQSRETRLLTSEKLSLADSAKHLAREVSILQEQTSEWAVQGAKRNRTLKELSARCEELESALTQERRDRAAELAHLMRTFERETEDMRYELQGLRSLMALKNRELRTVKKLAQIVLNQRTEVEQFFLDALTQVKLEIAKKRARDAEAAAAAHKSIASIIGEELQPAFGGPPAGPPLSAARGGGGASKSATTGGKGLHPTPSITLSVPENIGGTISSGVSLPAIATAVPQRGRAPVSAVESMLSAPAPAPAPGTAPGTAAANAAGRKFAPGSRVDIADLGPEDRERVLRLLFAKINNLDTRVIKREGEGEGAGAASQQPAEELPPRHPAAAAAAATSGRSAARGAGGVAAAAPDGSSSGWPLAEGKGPDSRGGSRAATPADGFALAAPFGLTADLPPGLGFTEYRGGGGGGGVPRSLEAAAGTGVDGAGAAFGEGEGEGEGQGQGEEEADTTALATALADKAAERARLADTMRRQNLPGAR